ncbi:transcriptional regulator [Pseudomonas syringae KCTC 12500]|uniref:LysR substrate-binding domain-containing protein n=1 Tax=Pseudomonas syringae TaxID=317 RepID=UPI0004179F7F|nr:LysR family transcriptional regulator [Pseudomonas syringae]KMY03850.1 transcriptional regulator [Pseudomonas syringae KCTC 12500]POR87156.1 LysR family transcriptional regulator [Pseudomonas syringae pv. syringae]
MQVFVKLAELGSFTKVADATQVGRPHVTRIIQDLEASLDVRLFQRTTRSVKLTAEGQRFYERVKNNLADLAETTSMFDRNGSTLRGRLRIDIPAAFSQRSFMESLKGFTRAFPDIELALGVTDRTVDLVAEGIDCALRIGELPDSSLVVREIGRATMVTCAAPSYLQAFGTPETLDELAGHCGVSFLSGQSNRPLPWHFSLNGDDFALPPRGGITVNESNAYVQCGLAGFGILQAPGIAVESFLASGELVEVLEKFRPLPRPVSVLYPSRTHLAPQVQAFIAWLREHFPKLHLRWFDVR